MAVSCERAGAKGNFFRKSIFLQGICQKTDRKRERVGRKGEY